MGSVLAARRRSDGAELAVKLLAGFRAQDVRARNDFAHEIWSLARLDHPGIVAVIDWGVVDAEEDDPEIPALLVGTPYLVMERAHGHLSRSRFPGSWDELVPLLQQILAALAHAHARNVVHRDLKPSNVLFTEGHWKLADFGIAHAMDRHAADHSWTRTVGTPAYMAPEQIGGAWRDFGPWTDLYAVGVLVHELVTGLTPFPSLEGKALLRAVVEQPIPAPLKTRFPVPPDFDAFLARLLERNFLDRAQRAADVSLWLEQLGAAQDPDTTMPLEDLDEILGTTRTLPADGIDAGRVTLRLLPQGPAPERLPRKPVPPDWRPLETASEAPAPAETTIPRALQFTGREAQRDVLWDALVRVDRGQGAHAVVIHGPRGSGRTALARWALERAHELGAAWQLVATHTDPPGPLDGVGSMFATFLRSVGLPRHELVDRMRTLLQLREGSGGIEHVVVELMAPAGPDDDAPVRFSSTLERNAAALGALQVLTGVLGGETDTAPRRNVVALLDDAHLGPETLGLVQLALANREGLPTPILFLLTVDEGSLAKEIAAIEALDGAIRIDLPPLPAEVRVALDGLDPTPGVEVLRTQVGPPVAVERDALERAIHQTISGTATTSDDL